MLMRSWVLAQNLRGHRWYYRLRPHLVKPFYVCNFKTQRVTSCRALAAWCVGIRKFFCQWGDCGAIWFQVKFIVYWPSTIICPVPHSDFAHSFSEFLIWPQKGKFWHIFCYKMRSKRTYVCSSEKTDQIFNIVLHMRRLQACRLLFIIKISKNTKDTRDVRAKVGEWTLASSL